MYAKTAMYVIVYIGCFSYIALCVFRILSVNWDWVLNDKLVPIKNIFYSASFGNPISVPAKRVETAIFNPRGETLKVGFQTSVSNRSTGAAKLVFSVRNVQIQCVNNIQKSDILVLVAFLRTSKKVNIISYHKIHCDPFFFSSNSI